MTIVSFLSLRVDFAFGVHFYLQDHSTEVLHYPLRNELIMISSFLNGLIGK